eukprot:scaffold1711_cov258-Prasinococcus_capsulatus_cf.AAC.3
MASIASARPATGRATCGQARTEIGQSPSLTLKPLASLQGTYERLLGRLAPLRSGSRSAASQVAAAPADRASGCPAPEWAVAQCPACSRAMCFRAH